MKSNLDLVKECDRSVSVSVSGCRLTFHSFPPHAETSKLFEFHLEGYDCSFGYMLPSTVSAITWPEYWQVDQRKNTVTLFGTSSNRSKRLEETLLAEHERGTFQQLKRWIGEIVSVYGPSKEVVLSIEKLAAPLFGIITYGVQLLAYRDDNDNSSSLKLWIARRAKTKRTFPGMLDSTVGGSLTTGETPFECLVRESAEEVSGI